MYSNYKIINSEYNFTKKKKICPKFQTIFCGVPGNQACNHMNTWKLT